MTSKQQNETNMSCYYIFLKHNHPRLRKRRYHYHESSLFALFLFTYLSFFTRITTSFKIPKPFSNECSTNFIPIVVSSPKRTSDKNDQSLENDIIVSVFHGKSQLFVDEQYKIAGVDELNTIIISSKLFFIRGGSSSISKNANLQASLKTNTTNNSPSSESISNKINPVYPLSIYSIQGKRPYMEDEYYCNQDGSFVAVMDGHGGGAVSKYLRQNLYASYLQAKASSVISPPVTPEKNEVHIDDITTDTNVQTISSDMTQNDNILSSTSFIGESTIDETERKYLKIHPVVDACRDSLKFAFQKIDTQVQNISHWSFQGSTAVAILLIEIPPQMNADGNDEINTPNTVLLSANVGDSRAVLSRAGRAIPLTTDHKPNSPEERSRIEKLGGKVIWCGPTKREVDENNLPCGVYRINGNLALSRAIGDRSERPLVSSEVDFKELEIDFDKDEFCILASDGVWDVFTSSQDVVDFCHEVLKADSSDSSVAQMSRANMAKSLVNEAYRRGSGDNITAIIIWLKDAFNNKIEE